MRIRPRRNRKSIIERSQRRETHIHAGNLVYPFFVVDGTKKKLEVSSLPGNYRWSLDLLLKEIEECMDLGLRSFVVFPAVDKSLKDATASYSWSSENFYLNLLHTLKKEFPQIQLITDVAMDPYS